MWGTKACRELSSGVFPAPETVTNHKPVLVSPSISRNKICPASSLQVRLILTSLYWRHKGTGFVVWLRAWAMSSHPTSVPYFLHLQSLAAHLPLCKMSVNKRIHFMCDTFSHQEILNFNTGISWVSYNSVQC